MAFNPFNWFRKHQKVLFAGLILITMLVFIGQFGRGDIFERGLAWFGGGRSNTPLITTLNGKRVYEGDLELLARKRRLASSFLMSNALASQGPVCKELIDNVKAPGLENPLSGLREVAETARRRAGMIETINRNPQFANFFLPQMRQDVPMIRRDLETIATIAARPKVKDDSRSIELLQKAATILGLQLWWSSGVAGLYFGGTDSTEDLLDFILWQQQADRLGIRLTEEDIKREVVAESGGNEVFESIGAPITRDKRVLAFLQQFANSSRQEVGFTGNDLRDALHEEFRVVIAQTSLLGEEQGIRSYRSLLGIGTSPAMAAPDEFLSYFRENRTTLRVQMLRIQAEKYLSRVTEQPSDAELVDLFDERKDREPMPDQRKPGFKEPRKAAIEYVMANPEDKYYKDLALKQVQAMLKLSDAKERAKVALSAIGNHPLAHLLVSIDPLQMEYESDLRKADHLWFHNPRAPLLEYDEQLKKLHYSSVISDPAVGGRLLLQSGGNPLVNVWSLYGASTLAEVKENLKLNLTQLLGGSDPQQLFGIAALSAVVMPKPIPRQLMEPQIIASLEGRQAADEVRKVVESLTEEMVKLKGQTAKIRALIDKTVATGQVKWYRMPKPQTRLALADLFKAKPEPALAALRDTIRNRLPAQNRNIEGVVGNLFMGSGTYDPQRETMSETPRAEYLYWRWDDLPARAKSFGEARGEVLAAWRLEKARHIARREAEQAVREVNEKKLSARDAEALLRDKNLGTIFELENVAQLLPRQEPLAGRATVYVPYEVPDQTIESFPYPPLDLAKQLMALKREGEAAMVADRPASNYYIAVLQNRSEPKLGEFKTVYKDTPMKDTLYTSFLMQRRAEYRKALIEQFRIEAKAADSEGQYQLPPTVKKRASVLNPRDEGE